MYWIINLFHVQLIECFRRIIIVIKEWFLKFQIRKSWIYQDELVIALKKK